MESKLAIDTVILSQDQEGQILGYHMDVDCDGTIDLIGYQKKGSAEIESYRVPDHVMRTDILALELDSAFKGRKVPYPALRVCQ
jgi:hypothetical protein